MRVTTPHLDAMNHGFMKNSGVAHDRARLFFVRETKGKELERK
jgi:hypothetical protein